MDKAKGVPITSQPKLLVTGKGRRMGKAEGVPIPSQPKLLATGKGRRMYMVSSRIARPGIR